MKNNKPLLLFFVTFFCYCYFFQEIPDANENSRLDLVYSIVDQGTLRIDRYQQNTIDKAYYGGHYYSDKEPGTALLAVPVYGLFKIADKIFSLNAGEQAARYIVRIAVISLPSALLSVLIYQFLGYFSRNGYYRLLLAVCYSLGTIAFTYSALFYGHQLAAFLLFSSFYLLFVMKQGGKEDNPRLAISGFLAGYAFITEYQTAAVSIFIFVYLYSVLNRKSAIIYFFLGSLVPVLALMAYNYSCFGNVFRVGRFYESVPAFKDTISKGFAGITYPKPGALFSLFFAFTRGLFFLSPFLLLSIPGFYCFSREKAYRKEFLLFLCSGLAYLLIYSSFETPLGGWAFGPRYLVPVLPFFAVPVIFSLKYFENYTGRFFTVSGILSVALVFIGTMTDPRVPAEIENTLGKYVLPLFLNGYVTMNPGLLLGLRGLYSLMPLLVVLPAAGLLLAGDTGEPPFGRDKGFTAAAGLLVSSAVLLLLVFTAGKYSERVYNMLGLGFARDKKFAEAAEQFDRAVKINPGFTQAQYNLAGMLMNMKKYDEAIAVSRRLIGMYPGSREAYNFLGMIYYTEGKYEDASREYKRAIGLDPDFAEAYDNLGLSCDSRGLLQEGVKYHEKAIELDPLSLRAYRNLASVYVHQGQADAAIEIYRRAINVGPWDPDLHYGLGNIYRSLGENELASAEFKKYLNYSLDRVRISEIKGWLRENETFIADKINGGHLR